MHHLHPFPTSFSSAAFNQSSRHIARIFLTPQSLPGVLTYVIHPRLPLVPRYVDPVHNHPHPRDAALPQASYVLLCDDFNARPNVVRLAAIQRL